MTLERWTAFVGVLLVVVFTPGPDFAVILRHALHGTRQGFRAAAGTVTGLTGHTAAAALGLSALLAARPDILTAIRFAGAGYLLWLALQALRAAFRRESAVHEAPTRSPHPYLDGLSTNLLNPKALLFFLGLIPQFVVPGPTVTAQLLLLTGTTLVAAVLWFAVVVLAAARGRAALARSRVRRAVDAVTGSALLAVALGVVRG